MARTSQDDKIKIHLNDDMKQLAVESFNAFEQKIEDLDIRGQSIVDEAFLECITKFYRSSQKDSWHSIVVDCGGSYLKLTLCKIMASKSDLPDFQVICRKDIPINNMIDSCKSGNAIFDFIALEATLMAKKFEHLFDGFDSIIPCGLIFSYDISNETFDDCKLRGNSKKFNFDDILNVSLKDILAEKLHSYSSMLDKKKLCCFAILNDMVCFFCGMALHLIEPIVSAIIVASGMNMAHITPVTCSNNPYTVRKAIINTESALIGDTPHFFKVYKELIDKKDHDYIESIGSDHRIAEKLISGIYMSDNFLYNLQLQDKLCKNSNDKEVLKSKNIDKISFKQLSDYFLNEECPNQTKEILGAIIPDSQFSYYQNELLRIILRSATLSGAILYLTLRKEDHLKETINFGIQGGIIENVTQYRSVIIETIQYLTQKLEPESKIKTINLKMLDQSLLIGMAGISQYLSKNHC